MIAEVDTLQFRGAGLTAENLLLTQQDDDLLISFEGVQDTQVVLQDLHWRTWTTRCAPGVRQ